MLALFTAALRDQAGVVYQPGADRHVARPLPLMDLYPAFDDFAARFDAGASQVVWTRLVADLETPVCLMLKLAEARQDSLPARIGRGRRGARPLLDHRASSPT